ncbi:MAG: hypothetical protein ABIA37_00470 [Candidatus Woesearchaeota archaeon]
MAVNEWKIWNRFKKDDYQKKKTVPIKEELAAVISFLKETELRMMITELEKMRELAEEEGLVDGELIEKNLKEQIHLFDQIIQKYDFFQNDVDINGLRMKKIAVELLKRAEHHKMKELVEEKKKDLNWRE